MRGVPGLSVPPMSDAVAAGQTPAPGAARGHRAQADGRLQPPLALGPARRRRPVADHRDRHRHHRRHPPDPERDPAGELPRPRLDGPLRARPGQRGPPDGGGRPARLSRRWHPGHALRRADRGVLPAEHGGNFVGVGLFEETAKALVVVGVGWRIAERRPRDGMVLGATVGAGFASFESAGYALQTFIDHRADHPVTNILSTEAQRGLLSPFGHLTWTALVGGAIFAAWRSGAFRPVASGDLDVPGRRCSSRRLGFELRLGDRDRGGPGRPRLGERLAEHRGLDREADRLRADHVQRRVRPVDRPERGDRDGLGDPGLADYGRARSALDSS